MKTKKHFKPILLGVGVVGLLFTPIGFLNSKQPNNQIFSKNNVQRVTNIEQFKTALLDQDVYEITLENDIDMGGLTDSIDLSSNHIFYKTVNGNNHRIFNNSTNDFALLTFEKEQSAPVTFTMENIVFDNVNGVIDELSASSSLQFTFSNLDIENIENTNVPTHSPLINNLSAKNVNKVTLDYDNLLFRNNNFNITKDLYSSKKYSLLGNIALNNTSKLEVNYNNILVEDNYFALESNRENVLIEALLNNFSIDGIDDDAKINLKNVVAQNNHFIDTDNEFLSKIALITSTYGDLDLDYDNILFLNNEWSNITNTLFSGFNSERITTDSNNVYILNDQIAFDEFVLKLTDSVNLEDYIGNSLPAIGSNEIESLLDVFNKENFFKPVYSDKHLVKLESEFLTLKKLDYSINGEDEVKSIFFKFDIASIDYRYELPFNRIELFANQSLLVSADEFSQIGNQLEVSFKLKHQLTLTTFKVATFDLKLYTNDKTKSFDVIEYNIDRNQLDVFLSNVSPSTPMPNWVIALIVIVSLIFIILIILIILFLIKQRNEQQIKNPNKKTKAKKIFAPKSKQPVTAAYHYAADDEDDYDYEYDTEYDNYDYQNYEDYVQDETNQEYEEVDNLENNYQQEGNAAYNAKLDYADETIKDDYTYLSSEATIQQDQTAKGKTTSKAIVLKEKTRKVKPAKKGSLFSKSSFFNKKKITATKNSIFEDIEQREKDNQKVLNEYLNEDDLRDDPLNNIKSLINDTNNKSDDYLNFG